MSGKVAISLNIHKIIALQGVVLAVLLLGNMAGIYITYFTSHHEIYTVTLLVKLFNFDFERNLPTVFSSCILLFSGFLLHYIALHEKKPSRPYKDWLLLAVIFYYLAIDEAISLHEILIHPVRKIGTTGIFFWAWVIPYGLALLVFILYYLRFLRKLPAVVAKGFIIAGVIYVAGAIGFEMWGAHIYTTHNETLTFSYALVATVEELLEMLGILYFIRVLLYYIECSYGGLRIKFSIDHNKPENIL